MNFRNFSLATLLCALGLVSFSACDNDDDETIQTQIENNIVKDSWRITEFIDSGFDETSNFAGFDFTFDEDGSVVASLSAISYTGTWSVSDNDPDDDIVTDLEFNINFPQTNEFEDLNDDWDIVSESSTKIELMEFGGGGSGTDFLTFEKN